MNYYDLRNNEWKLLIKGQKEPINGFFVHFIIPTQGDIVGKSFPENKGFLFCPTKRLVEFNNSLATIKEVPEYLLSFDKSEIELLNATIPFQN